MESTIWTEKYRPSTFAEIRGQQEIIEKVEAFVKSGNMPHLLFSGPAGVGKTTLSLVIAKRLFGENWRENTLELNASDERGIDVVRVKVKDFARTKALGEVPFKIIYLDESDALTREAQQALRRTMENFTRTCRFILSCNSPSKIIDPIQSRCAIFRFRPLTKEEVLAIIDEIAKKENLKIDSKGKEALFEISQGDIRKLENVMQSASASSSELTEELVYAMAAAAKPKEVLRILEFALENKFVLARDLLMKIMYDYGLSGLDMIKYFQRELLSLKIDNRAIME